MSAKLVSEFKYCKPILECPFSLSASYYEGHVRARARGNIVTETLLQCFAVAKIPLNIFPRNILLPVELFPHLLPRKQFWEIMIQQYTNMRHFLPEIIGQLIKIALLIYERNQNFRTFCSKRHGNKTSVPEFI